MTARTVPVTSKTCANPTCGATFHPGRGQSRQSWMRTRYCSPGCYVDPHPNKTVGKKAGDAAKARTSPEWHGVSGRYFLDDGPGDLSWQADAACRFHDSEIWFPVGTSGPSLVQAAQAKAICRSCPVVMECALWAMNALEHGIAGGLDEEERRALKRDNAQVRAS